MIKTDNDKVRLLLYDYFSSNKFLSFLVILSTFYIIQFLYLLEHFHWLSLVDLLIPFYVYIGLVGFYRQVKKKENKDTWLNISIAFLSIRIMIVVAICIITIIQMVYSPSFSFIVLTYLIFAMLLSVQTFYYSGSSLKIIKDMFIDGKIYSNEAEETFHKAMLRYIIMGIINLIGNLLILNDDTYEKLSQSNLKVHKLISFGDFSKVIEILLICYQIIIPFIIFRFLRKLKKEIKDLSVKIHEEKVL